jgi:GNAT superfamily N-acetyltransferase
MRVRDLVAGHDPTLLRRAYEELLEPSFPPAELVPLAELEEAYANAAPGTYGAVLLSDDRPVGVALADLFPRANVLMLGYLAVCPDWRGRGVASMLLRTVVPLWAAESRAAFTAVEVEDPRFHQGGGTYGDPAARLRLYERAGATLLPVPYVQPCVRKGQSRVGGMLLLALGAAGSGIPAVSVHRFLEDYFTTCEGTSVLRDPEYVALIDSVYAHGDVLPQWTIRRYAAIHR